MSKKVILAIIVNLFLAMSIYSLFTLVSKHAKQIDETSHLRFCNFIGLHAMLFISVIIMVRLEEIYNFVVLGFANSLTASICLIICESQVRQIQSNPHYNYQRFTGKTYKLELTFLNVYFLIYMYAIIGLIITSIFLLATEILVCWQEHRVNYQINKCLKKRTYDQSIKGGECTICLQEFEENDRSLLEVKVCSHIFHQQCLVQWIGHSNTCPLDRKDIFQYENQQIQVQDQLN